MNETYRGCLVLLLLTTGVSRLAAQGSLIIPPGVSRGVTIDRLILTNGYPDEITLLTFRSTRLERDAAAIDFSAGVLLQPGALAADLEIGPAWSFTLPNATILARGGFTLIGAVSAAGAGGIYGGYLGGGLLIRVGQDVALRGDVTHNWYNGGDGDRLRAWRVGIGLVVIPLPSGAKAPSQPTDHR